MTGYKNERAKKEMNRANKSLLAAKTLFENNLYENCVSRVYYSVLHAAKAALALNGFTVDSHKGARSMFSLHLVKTGKIEKEFAKILTAEQEDREICDYDVDIITSSFLATWNNFNAKPLLIFVMSIDLLTFPVALPSLQLLHEVRGLS